MAWLVLVVGTLLFLIGIVGQFFGLGKRPPSADGRRAGFFVLRIVSAVVGFWLVAVSIAHVVHFNATGRWW